MLKNPPTNENCEIDRNYQKTTIAATTDHATAIHEDINLSNIPLTQDEIDILKLGLSFTLTPKQNIAQLENDVHKKTHKKITIDLPLPKQQHC